MKLFCRHRRTFKKSYCELDSERCYFWRWAWCRGLIFGILTSISIAYFAYGIVYAWQKAEDRVTEIQQIRAEQKKFDKEIDYLERQIEETNKAMVRYWKRYGEER